MSASDLSPRTAAAERASLGAVLGERNIWLLFVLGICTGFPLSLAWLDLFPRADASIDKASLLILTGFGIGALVSLIAAPLLDVYRAPPFARLGHRRSWVALFLAAALILTMLRIATAFASEAAALRYAAVSGFLAFPVSAMLWIAVDALRIDLYRGRAQAVAFAAQYFGALAAWALASRVPFQQPDRTPLFLFFVLLAVAFGALLFVREPAFDDASRTAAQPTSPPARYVRPWREFFARHRGAWPGLVAAFAFYALAGGAADYLGKQGYVVDILATQRWQDLDFEKLRGVDAISTQEITLYAIGALIGLWVAFRRPPAHAFRLLLYAFAALLGLFALCKAWLGFTVATVGGLFALRSLILGASYVIYATVAARLTARPHTASQYMLLALFSGLFWISEAGFNALGAAVGSSPIVAAALVAALAAILCMRAAARAARSEQAIDRA